MAVEEVIYFARHGDGECGFTLSVNDFNVLFICEKQGGRSDGRGPVEASDVERIMHRERSTFTRDDGNRWCRLRKGSGW
jgi:hypothetical protein